MGILHDTTTLAALSLASCEDWTHDPWFTRPVLYHWAKEALYVHKDNKKITSTYENYGRKCREKKYYTASREDWTLDPWFTRPVLCHWAIEAPCQIFWNMCFPNSKLCEHICFLDRYGRMSKTNNPNISFLTFPMSRLFATCILHTEIYQKKLTTYSWKSAR